MADPTKITINQLAPAKIVLNPAPVTINNSGGSTTPATTSTLGVVIVGANLSITGNGVLSATGGGGSVTSNLPWANITARATTLLGYGIVDALTAANLTGYLLFSTANTTYSVLGHTHTIANVINLQSTLDAKQPTGSYVLTSNSALTDARTPLAHTQAWSTITGTPTLMGVGGYGITDGLTAAAAASTYLAQTTAASTYVTASDANNAFVAKTISVATGAGLTGGGALSVSRTLAIDSTVVTLTGAQTLTNKSIAAEQLNSGTLANARLGVSTTALTYAASVTWASDYLKVATITLAGACALTITGLTAGGTYNLIVKQDATGSRIMTWPTIKWSAGAVPTLSTAANAIDIVSFIYDGTTLYGTALKGFA